METQIDGRFVHGKANYSSDITESFDLNKPYGPNDNGELMWALMAEYDHIAKKSTVYFSLNPPVEVEL